MRTDLRMKLRLAQLKDVAEMQQIYEAATESGAGEACRKVLGGTYALSVEVREGVEAHAGIHCK